MTQLVLPSHTNAIGTIFGGTMFSWIDIAAAIAATRHCQTNVVTASIDALHFLAPAKLGDIVTIKASVNYVGKTSMEIGVRVDSENPTLAETRHTASAYLTFVALDSHGVPTPAPELLAKSSDEKRRYEQAKIRRAARIRLAEEVKKHADR